VDRRVTSPVETDHPSQLELQDEVDAAEGLDPWIRSLPCPPWEGADVESEAA
jgi:hypothetical protein